MQHLKNKWESLESSRTSSYILEPLDAFNLFIGLSPKGHRILALDIKDQSVIDMDLYPSWNGAPVDHQKIDNCYYIIITLLDETQKNIFDDLIHNLILRFASVVSINDALDIYSVWLLEYQIFFKKDKIPLNKSAQRGLIGELLFLLNQVFSLADPIPALQTWRGHDRKYHDFSFVNGNVEIKTTISKEPKKVYINNEKQLDDINLNSLLLCVYSLKEVESGKSLPEYIDDVHEILQENESATNLFNIFLTHAKYHHRDREKYLSYKISEDSVNLYKIEEGFPRIIEVQQGVGDIKYSLTLASCHEFLVDMKVIREMMD